jgi:hypothetical protein
VDSINEKTDYFVTITFKDEDGNLVTPTAAYYSIYCETTRHEILAETALGGLSTSVEVIVTAAQNAIRDNRNSAEKRLLTARFTYLGGAYQATAEHRWQVMNLRRLT